MLTELRNAREGGFGRELKAEDNTNHCSVGRFYKASVHAGYKMLSLSKECYFFLIFNILAMFAWDKKKSLMSLSIWVLSYFDKNGLLRGESNPAKS